jgi:hypothetical protein
MVIFIFSDLLGRLILQRFVIIFLFCLFVHRHGGFRHWLCHPTDFSVKTIMIWRPSKSFCWEKFLLLLVAFLLLVR